MIYLLQYAGRVDEEILLLSSLFPSPRLGISLVLASALLMLAYTWVHRKIGEGPSRTQSAFRWLIPSLAFAGTYIFFLRWVDEVFINLEHPWNLYHFGLYSFSPARMVDGTVEVLYYLLLTPFAESRATLVIANIVLAGLLGLAHLALIFRILSECSNAFRILAGVLFAAWWPLVCIFANGFGTGIISLVFLAAASHFLKGVGNTHLWLAALLPLIRFDGIAYSGAVFFADLVEHRRVRWPQWLAAACALGCVLVFFRAAYGHWMPTPVSFKSVSPDMIGLIQTSDLARLVDYFQNPLHFAAMAGALAALILRRAAPVRRMLLLMPPLGVLFVFYTVVSWNPVYDGRYYFGWELGLVLLLLVLAGEWFGKEGVKALRARADSVFTWAGACLLVVTASGLYLDGTGHRYTAVARGGWRPYYSQRIDGLAFGGAVLDRVIPRDWTISATELNSFGFMHDREILDLWGYTNPQIATSRSVSGYRIRNAPTAFLEASPDVHWHRTGRRGTIENQSADYENFERAFFSSPNIAPFYDQLGDMNEVVTHYDFMLLRTGKWWTTLLVRKDRTETLMSILDQRNYQLAGARPLDRHKFEKVYGSD